MSSSPSAASIVELQMIGVLVDAGATPTSAVRAAEALLRGRPISEAFELIELAGSGVDVDAELLAAAIASQRERVQADRA